MHDNFEDNTNNGLFSASEFDRIIRGAFRAPTLKELFDRRMDELGVSATTVADILNIDSRAMSNIVNGTKKIADYTNLVKIADFVQISKVEAISLYVEALELNFPLRNTLSPEKVKFIKDNFDLAAFKHAGFINSISDFPEIDQKITRALGLRSILDYKRPSGDVAFSSGAIKPKNENGRSQWIAFAIETFEEIGNENEYDRQGLIDYFPQIRWHSTNINLGLPSVIRSLAKFGVTVIYQAPLKGLHIRGATFSVNDKPCIVLTNYRGYYPTLWWVLLHELHHVLFEFEDIRKNGYHLSEDDEQELRIKTKEDEADQFGREYLFSVEKTDKIRHLINKSPDFVNKFAIDNHVHPSFAYVFSAFDLGKNHRWAWALANKNNPKDEMNNLLSDLVNPWENLKPVREHAKYLKNKFFN